MASGKRGLRGPEGKSIGLRGPEGKSSGLRGPEGKSSGLRGPEGKSSGRRASEDRLLAWLRRSIPEEATEPLLGDDAAILPTRGPLAVTVDSQIAGVHFPPDLPEPFLARRLLAVNLSDLAATGATPAYAFLALATVEGFDHQRFFRAFLSACRRHGLRLAGGDLARHPQVTSATLTLLGSRPRGGRFLSRGNARPGDALWLSGTVGESAAGRSLIASGARLAGRKILLPPALERGALAAAARRAVRRHLCPEPHLAVGRWLGRGERAAAIDLSDGLTLDLYRLCKESGVGAEIDAGALPFADRFPALCRAIGRDPLDLAYGGGEDYVLLFALPPGRRPPRTFHCARIGTITREQELRRIDNGRREALPVAGWDHLAAQ
jgi:thiamine-monophosphate kinase